MEAFRPTNNPREVRAIEMLRSGGRVAESKRSGEYLVASQSGNGLYRVRVHAPFGPAESCECPDFQERLAPCKHILFVRHWTREDGPTPVNPAGQPSHHRATTRNWHLYDQSQTYEYQLFNTLLLDLANGFPEPERDPRKAGRKPIPLRDQAYWAIHREYLGLSLRRSHGLRQNEVALGRVADAHYYALGSHFLCRSDVRESLHDMLARSAMPLIGLENRCAIDGTGLRTTRFNYYRKEKYTPDRENDWQKLHALVGVKTHTIPVLEVTVGSANDSPQFPVLLKRAISLGFQFKEVYADKGYQSRENFRVANECDVLPFIPFKSNQTGRAKGVPIYHKMFHLFQSRRDEFDAHYRQRAQVESTFGAIKQKFSETLASRTFDSQCNEVLCLAIAHNITVLVRQMFESGILPDFLPPPANPQILSQTSNPLIRSSAPGLAETQIA